MFDLLIAIAAVATIANFLLDVIKEIFNRRTVKEDIKNKRD